MSIKQKFNAGLLASLFACGGTASLADCRPGDLAGTWSHHAEIAGPSGSSSLICEEVTFTNAGSGPARYNIFGFCKIYSASNPDPTIVAIGANSATVVELRSCKLTGTYDISPQSFPIVFPVTILDARIEDNGTTTKTHIHGIADFNSGIENVMNFTFTR